MPYTVERLPGEPIIAMSLSEPFSIREDLGPLFAQAAEFNNEIEGKIYHIADTRSIRVSFSDVVMGMAAAITSKVGAFTEPRVTVALVGAGDLIDLAAKAFKQPQYGSRHILVFNSMEEALSEIRAQIASGA